MMNEESNKISLDKFKECEILFDEFKECRSSFMTSLNTVTVLSVIIFVTTFIPYTSYVGNLLAIRRGEHNSNPIPSALDKKSCKEKAKQESEKEKAKQESEAAKVPNKDQKDKIYEYYKKCEKDEIKKSCNEIAQKRLGTVPDLNNLSNEQQENHSKHYRQCEQEITANFDLVDLQDKWLKAHNPSVKSSELSAESKIPTLIGDFSFKSGELTLVYPAIICLLMIYLFFHLHHLSDLRKELQQKGFVGEGQKILYIPIYRIILSWVLLCFLLIFSIISLNLSTCRLEKDISECEIPHRLGKIITQETSFQIDPDFDLWISRASLFIGVPIGVAMIILLYSHLDLMRK